MAEGRRVEAWKQITWLRAGWTMKPGDAANLNVWNPLIGAGGGGRVHVDGDFNRAMGAALEAEAAKGT